MSNVAVINWKYIYFQRANKENRANVSTVNTVLGQEKLATVFPVISCQQQIVLSCFPPSSIFMSLRNVAESEIELLCKRWMIIKKTAQESGRFEEVLGNNSKH